MLWKCCTQYASKFGNLSSGHRTGKGQFSFQSQRSEVKWSEVAQSCPTLCDPMDCSPAGSLVYGIFQAWILEWVAISFSRGSSRPRDWTQVSRIVGRCFTIWATREALFTGLSSVQFSSVAQSCPTLCDPMGCSLPGSSVHGLFQAIVLEWIAISISRGSSQPREQTQVSCIAGRGFIIWATREALFHKTVCYNY